MDRSVVAISLHEKGTGNPPPGGFPLRAAAIDVGSNAMRLLAAEFSAPGSWTPLSEQRVPVRLGAAVFAADGGAIPPETMDAAVQALLGFRQRMDASGVTRYRAVATSAVREARNGSELVQRARTEADIRLETITGADEARLIWLAIANRIEPGDGSWILVDLGGGSVEIALARGSAVLQAESHPMGSVRMLAELGGPAGKPRRFRRRAGELIDRLVSGVAQQGAGTDGVVATGGNIEELARLAGARTKRGVSRLAVRDLADLIDELAELSTKKRIKRYGLRPDRADVIVPAALVYERIARMTGASELIVPYVGLREGVLLGLTDPDGGSF